MWLSASHCASLILRASSENKELIFLPTLGTPGGSIDVHRNGAVPATGWVAFVFRITVLMEGGGEQLYFLTSRESVCADAAWQMAFVSNG